MGTKRSYESFLETADDTIPLPEPGRLPLGHWNGLKEERVSASSSRGHSVRAHRLILVNIGSNPSANDLVTALTVFQGNRYSFRTIISPIYFSQCSEPMTSPLDANQTRIEPRLSESSNNSRGNKVDWITIDTTAVRISKSEIDQPSYRDWIGMYRRSWPK